MVFENRFTRHLIAGCFVVTSLFVGSSVWAAGTYGEAIKAYIAKDYTKAFDILLPLADSGNARAQFSLGLLFIHGEGVGVDGVLSYTLFNMAGRGGSKRAFQYVQSLNKILGESERAKAESLTSQWKPGAIAIWLGVSSSDSAETRLQPSTGYAAEDAELDALLSAEE
jgi:hypothetical protein